MASRRILDPCHEGTAPTACEIKLPRTDVPVNLEFYDMLQYQTVRHDEAAAAASEREPRSNNRADLAPSEPESKSGLVAVTGCDYPNYEIIISERVLHFRRYPPDLCLAGTTMVEFLLVDTND